MKSKLALGTVQFGIHYGINNTTGIPDQNELHALFSLAQKQGIQTFDTAIAYGNAEERIRPFLFEGARIISKFPPSTTVKSLEPDLMASLKRLGQYPMYAFIAHNADVLLEKPDLWDELIRLQAQKKILKKGYSLYHPVQLEKLLDKGFLPDLVQLPYNLLDRRFGLQLRTLHEMGVEIHVRSVFLQGLLFMDRTKLPLKLQAITSELKQLHDLVHSEEIDILSLALNFVAQNPEIDQVLIGVDSTAQLQMNLNALHSWDNHKNTIFNQVLQITCSHPELLNPSNW